MAARPDDSGPRGPQDRPRLNENHRRHLLASCRYIDRLLSDVDNIVAAADSQSPFARYANDLSPALSKLLRDYFGRLRTDMLQILERHDAMPEGDRISALHAVRTALGFIDISIEELKPQYMTGYGAVPDALKPELNGLAEELKNVVATLDRALAAGAAGSFEARLARLERAGRDTGVLRALERIIGEQGLVEFRPALEVVLSRLEDRQFEVAVFGRVSSGKSSLLNHLIGRPLLPVGVTPITAVPTRIMHADTSQVEVTFADRKTEHATIERLREFVTEQENPGNTKHVTRLVVKLPAAGLSSGIVFVDTPGLGSLATTGTAETLAYLPRCDLGIVLIDAASTLTADDVNTIRLLQQAAVPAMVVLSKADLLNPADLDRALVYTARQVSQQLGERIGIHAVSTAAGHESLLDRWIHDDLGPLLARHQELARSRCNAKSAPFVSEWRPRCRPDSSACGRRPRSRRRRAMRQAFRTRSARPPGRSTRCGGRSTRSTSSRWRRSNASRSKPPTWSPTRWATESRTSRRHIVARVLATIGTERSDALARTLSRLANQSRQALATAARALELPQPATDEEWTSIMRDLPQLDPGPLTLDLHPVGLNALGRRVAAARIRSALRSQIGAQIASALETHGHVLRDWGLRRLARLRQQFDTQAQIYRAQLTAPPAEATNPTGIEKALRDLDALDSDETRRESRGDARS